MSGIKFYSLPLTGAIVLLSSAILGSETMKMITYYPAPYGSYKKFVTSGLTVLAKNSAGKVGIGTINPATKLDVGGTIRVGKSADNTPGCSGKSGALRYNNSLQYCDGSTWQDFPTADIVNKQISDYLTNKYVGKKLGLAVIGGTTCPAGSIELNKYWPAYTYPGYAGCGMSWCPSDSGCTTPAMWSNTAPTGTGVRYSYYAQRTTGTYPYTCSAPSWSQVQCVVIQ